MTPEEQRQALGLLKRAMVFAPERPAGPYPPELGDEIDDFLRMIADRSPAHRSTVTLDNASWTAVTLCIGRCFSAEKHKAAGIKLRGILIQLNEQLDPAAQMRLLPDEAG